MNNTEPRTNKRDCVNYHERGCVALTKTFCNKEDCRFYKTKKMLHEQIAKIRERLPEYGKNYHEH